MLLPKLCSSENNSYTDSNGISYPLILMGFLLNIKAVAGICAAAKPIKTFICILKPSPNRALTADCVAAGNEFTTSVVSSSPWTWSGRRMAERGDVIHLFMTLVTIAIPITPPRILNWATAAVPTAAYR